MSLVNERLLKLLPEGVLGMVEGSYVITYTGESDDEILCDMEIGSEWNNAYDWTFYVSAAKDMLIRFEAASGGDTTLRDRLVEKGADLDQAYTVEARVRNQFDVLDRTVKNITGRPLAFSHNKSGDVYAFYDITIDRNATTEELIDLAMAVDSFAEYSTREIGF